MQTKVCSRCNESKPATRDFFGGTGTVYGGLRGRCRECEKIAKREYEATHKGDRAKRDQKRAMAEGGVRRGGFSLEIKQDLLKKQHGICLCCCTEISSAQDAQVDHATPLAKGGGGEPSNLFLAHAQCNKEKHGKTLREHWEWRVRQGLDLENLGLKYGLLERFSK